jgi:hypothetical protein
MLLPGIVKNTILVENSKLFGSTLFIVYLISIESFEHVSGRIFVRAE